jgi:oligopeptidase A
LQADLADAQAHAAANGHDGELLWWDVAFWAERLREAKYDLKDEELRPYFALPAVLDGLFKVRWLSGVCLFALHMLVCGWFGGLCLL